MKLLSPFLFILLFEIVFYAVPLKADDEIDNPDESSKLASKYGPCYRNHYYYYDISFHGVSQKWIGAIYIEAPDLIGHWYSVQVHVTDAFSHDVHDVSHATGYVDYDPQMDKGDLLVCGFQQHVDKSNQLKLYQLRSCGFTNKDAIGAAAFCFNVGGGWWDPVMKPGGQGICIYIRPVQPGEKMVTPKPESFAVLEKLFLATPRSVGK